MFFKGATRLVLTASIVQAVHFLSDFFISLNYSTISTSNSKKSVDAMDSTALRISSPFSSFRSIILRYCPKSFALSSLSLSKSPRNSQNYTLKVDTRCRASKDGVVFDDAAYEAVRLSLDAKARESSMAEASEREAKDEDDPKAWKWVIRKRDLGLDGGPKYRAIPDPVLDLSLFSGSRNLPDPLKS